MDRVTLDGLIELLKRAPEDEVVGVTCEDVLLLANEIKLMHLKLDAILASVRIVEKGLPR